MPTPLRRRWHIILPALVALALSLPSITRGRTAGFKPDDTAWYAAIAMQAWQGDGGRAAHQFTLWGPTATVHSEKGTIPLGAPYFNKPPLVFWLHAPLLKLFGPHLWAARLPTLLAAAATCSILAWSLGVAVGRRTGATAGIVLALTYEFARHTQAISLDMWLALWNTLALGACLAAARTRRFRWVSFGGVAVGLGLLTKPLVASATLLAIADWVMWDRRPRGLRWLGVATLLAAAVALPWYLLMANIWGGAFTGAHFGREVAGRAAGTLGNANRAAGYLYYPRVLLETYWPWLAALLAAIVWMIRGPVSPRLTSTLRLFIAALFVWFVGLSLFPDRRPRYLLVLYPIAAAVVGIFLANAAPRWARDAAVALRRYVLPGALIAGIALALFTPAPRRQQQWTDLIAWLREDSSRLERLNEGAFSGQRGAVIFLELGRWPAPTRGIQAPGAPPSDRTPDRGEYLIYHRRDGYQPGPGETEVFRSGDITVTRLESENWSPVPTPDPGE